MLSRPGSKLVSRHKRTAFAVVSFASVASVWTMTDHRTRKEADSVARQVRGDVYRMATDITYRRSAGGRLYVARERITLERIT